VAGKTSHPVGQHLVTTDNVVFGEGKPHDYLSHSSWFTPPIYPLPQYGPGSKPDISDDITPHDLDIQVPLASTKWFDVEKFISVVERYGIHVNLKFKSHMCLVIAFDTDLADAPFGPFTADFIEPHFVALADRLDFDVNNLYVLEGYHQGIGLRVHMGYGSGEKALSLNNIVTHIQQKQFLTCREQSDNLDRRVKKMQKRGWTLIKQKIDILPTPVEGLITLLYL